MRLQHTPSPLRKPAGCRWQSGWPPAHRIHLRPNILRQAMARPFVPWPKSRQFPTAPDRPERLPEAGRFQDSSPADSSGNGCAGHVKPACISAARTRATARALSDQRAISHAAGSRLASSSAIAMVSGTTTPSRCTHRGSSLAGEIVAQQVGQLLGVKPGRVGFHRYPEGVKQTTSRARTPTGVMRGHQSRDHRSCSFLFCRVKVLPPLSPTQSIDLWPSASQTLMKPRSGNSPLRTIGRPSHHAQHQLGLSCDLLVEPPR